eukprot:1159170-Pelagomonas_calceolata.AAC.4
MLCSTKIHNTCAHARTHARTQAHTEGKQLTFTLEFTAPAFPTQHMHENVPAAIAAAACHNTLRDLQRTRSLGGADHFAGESMRTHCVTPPSLSLHAHHID